MKLALEPPPKKRLQRTGLSVAAIESETNLSGFARGEVQRFGVLHSCHRDLREGVTDD